MNLSDINTIKALLSKVHYKKDVEIKHKYIIITILIDDKNRKKIRK